MFYQATQWLCWELPRLTAVLTVVCTIAIGGVFTIRLLLDQHHDLVEQALAAGTPSVSQTNPKPVLPAFERDVRALAHVMWGEARNEGSRGMRAVAHVVTNRQADSGRPLQNVIFAHRQFSVYDAGIPPRPAADDLQYLAAMAIARDVLDGRSVDPTAGARFYHTVSCESAGCSSMREYGVRPAVIGSHVFYRSMRQRRIEPHLSAPDMLVVEASVKQGSAR